VGTLGGGFGAASGLEAAEVAGLDPDPGFDPGTGLDTATGFCAANGFDPDPGLV